jgi:hypothetical protein
MAEAPFRYAFGFSTHSVAESVSLILN